MQTNPEDIQQQHSRTHHEASIIYGRDKRLGALLQVCESSFNKCTTLADIKKVRGGLNILLRFVKEDFEDHKRIFNQQLRELKAHGDFVRRLPNSPGRHQIEAAFDPLWEVRIYFKADLTAAQKAREEVREKPKHRRREFKDAVQENPCYFRQELFHRKLIAQSLQRDCRGRQ